MKILKRFHMRYIKLFFVALFSFILGCMITINLIPINKTCLIETRDREYDIMRNSKLNSPDLIILIISAPFNLERRNIIRSTWLKLDSFRNTKIAKHYFVIGSSKLTTDNVLHLSSEQSKYDDLIIIPTHDTYENLTQKVLLSFVYLKEQLEVGLNFKYVLKCDDDSFVRLDSLLHELDHIELLYLKSNPKKLTLVDDSPYLRTNVQANTVSEVNQLQLYWGYFHGKAQIKTKGKWQEQDWILCDYYLPYALGGGYVLSKDLVVYLASNANSFKFYKSEDVSVGAWLSTANNVLRVHDVRFDTEWTSRGCQNFHLITHGVSVKGMRVRYNNIHKFGIMCEMEETKRLTYHYNWTLLPSKCCVNFV